MRQKVKSKNLNYSIIRVDKEKNIELVNNGGWHFNNLLSVSEISLKLKTFAHIEFSGSKFSSTQTIKKKIEKKIDLFFKYGDDLNKRYLNIIGLEKKINDN